jgi:hypothetical protein
MATTAKSSSVPNGDFEQLTTDGKLASWQLPANAQVIAENGNHFVRVSQPNAGNAWLTLKVPLKPEWKQLTVSGRLRLSGLKKGDAEYKTARLQFNFENAKGERIGDWPAMPTLTEDTGWKEVSETVVIPEGAKVLALWPGFMEAAGTLDIDDVQVTPVAAPATTAPETREGPQDRKALLWNGVVPSIPQDKVQVTLHVNGASPAAANSNDGSAGKPYKTIHAALQVALANKKNRIGTRVLIQPGLYRETILDEPGYGSPDTDTSAPLIIEAAVKGKVIVSGAADRTSGDEHE